MGNLHLKREQQAVDLKRTADKMEIEYTMKRRMLKYAGISLMCEKSLCAA